MRTTLLIAIAAIACTPAAAQKFGGSSYRAPAPVYRAPTPAPVYRAPTPVYRPPAPTPVYRAPAPVSRPAPVTRSTPTQKRPDAVVTTGRATRPAAKPLASTPRTGTPVLNLPSNRRGTVTTPSKRPDVTKGTASKTSPRSAHGVRQRRSASFRGSTYAWMAPVAVPFWWASTMESPYSYGAYDEFIERCLRTEPRERSRDCVRALKERGLAG